ncbi:hypothetical protein NMY22_g9663 [Coprinellus aureogranulatus]|nr:hypothetical protein NMY22_g9663 [Coprinellus aureogranulatus]
MPRHTKDRAGSPRPTQTAAGRKATPVKKASTRPSRCYKCPGRPLKTQCPGHNVSVPPAPKSLPPPALTLPSPPTIVASPSDSLEIPPCPPAPSIFTSLSPTALTALNNILEQLPSSAETLPAEMVESATTSLHEILMQLPPEAQTALLAQTQAISTPSTLPEQVVQAPDFGLSFQENMEDNPPPLDSSPYPFHLARNSAHVPIPLRPSQQTAAADPVPVDDDDPGLAQDEKLDRKRVYASDGNPIHGYIEGLGRGNFIEDMARVRELKKQHEEHRLVVKAFDTLIRDFLTRAEDVSRRTSCWLYVAVQHPSSRQSYLHFASEKLRREAGEDLDIIHGEVGRMMANLKLASRTENVVLLREKADALKKASEAEAEAAAYKSKLSALEAKFKKFESMFATLGMSVD